MSSGVFDTAGSQTLYLWVDVKTPGPATWPFVVRALEPLRSRGYLTKVSDDQIVWGAVTVIGTGATPLNQVAPVANRDYFYDGPLQSLAKNNITATISPIASAQLSSIVGKGTPLNKTQIETLHKLVGEAAALGIKSRLWDLPEWPIKTRDTVWRQLVDEVYLLNVDDLEAAATGAW